MHFATFAPFLISLASALPSLEVRAAPDYASAILTNLTTVESDIVTLNNTLNQTPDNGSFGFYALLAIQSQSNTILADLNSTIHTANISSVWTQSESTNIGNEVTNGLQPKTYDLLNNLVRHRPAFSSGGLDQTVHDNLVQQRELSRELGNSFSAKLVDPAKSKAPGVTADILSHFDSAIQQFST